MTRPTVFEPSGTITTVTPRAPKLPLKITLRRSGDFAVNFSGSNANQCGWIGQQVLHFDVVIEAWETALNSQGFIIDNNDVLAYFVGAYTTVGLEDYVSCEIIARDSVLGLHALVSAGGCEPEHVEVSISGGPQATLTAVWNKTTHGSLFDPTEYDDD